VRARRYACVARFPPGYSRAAFMHIRTRARARTHRTYVHANTCTHTHVPPTRARAGHTDA